MTTVDLLVCIFDDLYCSCLFDDLYCSLSFSVPVPPASVIAAVDGPYEITLTITKPSPGLVEYYNITYMDAGGAEINESVEYINTVTTHPVISLKAGTTYTFTLHSWSNGEQSLRSTVSVPTTTGDGHCLYIYFFYFLTTNMGVNG